MTKLPKNPIEAPDYEQIAPDYDDRYVDGGLPGIQNLVGQCMDQVSPGRWLEVGCGTGQWLTPSPAEVQPFGLDQSRLMLSKAAGKAHGVPLTQGSAVDLPFAAGAFAGLATIHAVHHFPDQDRFLQEAFRVLSSDGSLLILGMNAQDPELEWYMYEFFEGVAERDRARFPNYDDLTKRLDDLGFSEVRRGLAHMVDERLVGQEVFDQDFLSRRGCSQMALLSDEAYARGIGRIQDRIRQDPDYVFRVYVPLEYLWAMK